MSKVALKRSQWVDQNMSLPIQHFFAASIGECTQALVRNPFEVIKQNQQIGVYNTISDAISSIYAKRGIGGFYRGYFSLVGREIPFSGLQFPLYEWFKRLQIRYYSKQKNIPESHVTLGFWNNAINGSLAGSIAGYIVTPVDVIKTRSMTHDVNSTQASIKQIITQILSEDGIKGLYRGATMRILYLSFGGCAFFGIYESIKSKLEHSLYSE